MCCMYYLLYKTLAEEVSKAKLFTVDIYVYLHNVINFEQSLIYSYNDKSFTYDIKPC